MSKEYPCVYHENGLCAKFAEPGCVSYCVYGPCSHQTPSRGDRIRAMDDKELADFIQCMIDVGDISEVYCPQKPECFELIDSADGIPEEWCRKCLMEWLWQPSEEAYMSDVAYIHARAAVNAAPTVEPRKGRWVAMYSHKNLNNWVECSECKTVGSPFWKYCPMCEAKMEGGAEDG